MYVYIFTLRLSKLIEKLTSEGQNNLYVSDLSLFIFPYIFIDEISLIKLLGLTYYYVSDFYIYSTSYINVGFPQMEINFYCYIISNYYQ